MSKLAMNTGLQHSFVKHQDIQNSHKQLRATIRQQRRQLSPEQQQQAPVLINQHLQNITQIQTAQNVALFLSFDGELNTMPLIEQFWQQGKAVYLPVLHPFSPGNLLFLRYKPDTELIKHTFGLKQPRLDVSQVIPTNELDVIFTPLVAFDKQGNRLGMGGGYYDRTLQNWQEKHIYPIGLAHDCQYVNEIKTEQWDVALPEIVTPTKRWLFK